MKANRASVRVSGLMWCAGGTVEGDIGEGAQGGGAWSDRAAARWRPRNPALRLAVMRSRAGLRHLPDDPRTFSCPYAETWRALHLVPCSTSVRRGKKRLELGLNHESSPIGAPVRWAPDASPMGVIGPHRAPSDSRSDGLLCLMRADAARCTILAEADDCRPSEWRGWWGMAQHHSWPIGRAHAILQSVGLLTGACRASPVCIVRRRPCCWACAIGTVERSRPTLVKHVARPKTAAVWSASQDSSHQSLGCGRLLVASVACQGLQIPPRRNHAVKTAQMTARGGQSARCQWSRTVGDC